MKRAWFLLVNLADNDNEPLPLSEIDFVALPVNTLDELATQMALGRLGFYIRRARTTRPN